LILIKFQKARGRPHITAQIAGEIYTALDRLGADEELLAIGGSSGDTLDDADVLTMLRTNRAAVGARWIGQVSTDEAIETIEFETDVRNEVEVSLGSIASSITIPTAKPSADGNATLLPNLEN